jgi:hypothetical protein
MVYQQEDVQEDSIFSPTCVAGSVNGMRKRGPLKPGIPGHPKHCESLYTVIGLTLLWQVPLEPWLLLITALMEDICFRLCQHD